MDAINKNQKTDGIEHSIQKIPNQRPIISAKDEHRSDKHHKTQNNNKS